MKSQWEEYLLIALLGQLYNKYSNFLKSIPSKNYHHHINVVKINIKKRKTVYTHGSIIIVTHLELVMTKNRAELSTDSWLESNGKAEFGSCTDSLGVVLC